MPVRLSTVALKVIGKRCRAGIPQRSVKGAGRCTTTRRLSAETGKTMTGPTGGNSARAWRPRSSTTHSQDTPAATGRPRHRQPKRSNQSISRRCAASGPRASDCVEHHVKPTKSSGLVRIRAPAPSRSAAPERDDEPSGFRRRGIHGAASAAGGVQSWCTSRASRPVAAIDHPSAEESQWDGGSCPTRPQHGAGKPAHLLVGVLWPIRDSGMRCWRFDRMATVCPPPAR